MWIDEQKVHRRGTWLRNSGLYGNGTPTCAYCDAYWFDATNERMRKRLDAELEAQNANGQPRSFAVGLLCSESVRRYIERRSHSLHGAFQ